MEITQLEIRTNLQIRKTPAEVFEAIVDPIKMCNYFISKSNGRLESGKTLLWKFPEFDFEFQVNVVRIENNKSIIYTWKDLDAEYETTVTISMMLREGNSTLVTITEGPRENNLAGLKWLQGNTEGWANFLACLKAYLEFGINLRKGGFDFLKAN